MRKLNEREKENRMLDKIVKRIKTIEKDYGLDLTRKACIRFYQRTGNELKLRREIKEKEEQLQELKSKAKK
jgi:hypothetical protein